MSEIMTKAWITLRKPYRLFANQKLIHAKLEAIEIIHENHEGLTTVNYLFDYLRSKDENPVVKDKIAKVIHEIMTQALSENDYEIFSKQFDRLTEIRRSALTISQVQSFASLPHHNTLLGIASMNKNGYAREHALKLIDFSDNKVAVLLYVLKRLNDYVPQIRSLSESLISENLENYTFEELYLCFASIDYLKRVKHTQDLRIYHQIIAQMEKYPNKFQLAETIEPQPFEKQHFILDLLHNSIKTTPQLFEKLITCKGINLKRTIIRRFDLTLFTKQQIDSLLRHKNAIIRQAILIKLTPALVKDHITVIETLLYDHSSNVRETARYLYNQNVETHFLNFYRKLINNPTFKNHPGVIMGLAEMASKEDVQTLKSYAQHANKQVRAIVLSALYRLTDAQSIELVLQSILDKSGMVRKIAVNILSKSTADKDNILRDFMKTKVFKVKLACLSVLASRKNYAALLDILMAHNLNDKSDAFQINQKLDNWHRIFLRIYSPLDKETFHQIKAALDAIDPQRIQYGWIDRLIDFTVEK